MALISGLTAVYGVREHEVSLNYRNWSGGQRLRLHFRSQGPASYF